MKGYDWFLFSAIHLMVGWFTITPMLQDLDSLAARIGQMVQFNRQLQDERTALQARIKSLDQERNALRDRLQRYETDQSSLAEQVTAHQAELKALQDEALATQTSLQVDVSSYKAECEALRQKLNASQADTSRLRSVADKAKEQIDSILMRLPGAPQE